METPADFFAEGADRQGAEGSRELDTRSDFERDRSRIIHSAAFRRLQAKTQVLGIGEGDFHRTRLTHSLEVAQICRGIVSHLERTGCPHRAYLPPLELAEAAGFAHDLGHPPFGHGGEAALNYFMYDHGGFEGNGQTLRLAARLEAHTKGHGLNLTRRMLLSLLKYPAPFSRVIRAERPHEPADAEYLTAADFKPPKCYHDDESGVVDWMLAPFSAEDRERFVRITPPSGARHGKTHYKTLDCSLMDMADEIAYGTHDLEDGIALGIITRAQWDEAFADFAQTEWGSTRVNELASGLFSADKHERKHAAGSVIHLLISNVRVAPRGEFAHPLLDLQAELPEDAARFLKLLKDFTYKYMIDLHSVRTLENRGQRIIIRLLSALMSDPGRLLTPGHARQYGEGSSESARRRVVCDYVAGMTDEYATRLYERFFVPRHGTVFERL